MKKKKLKRKPHTKNIKDPTCEGCKKVRAYHYTNGYVICSGIVQDPFITKEGDEDIIRICLPRTESDVVDVNDLKIHEAMEIAEILLSAINSFGTEEE